MPKRRPSIKNMPHTAKEAIEYLKKHLQADDKKFIRGLKKDDLISLHHSLGMCIRNGFGMWGVRHNKKLLADIGGKLPDACLSATQEEYEMHPDDASQILIERLWRDLKKDKLPTRAKEEKR